MITPFKQGKIQIRAVSGQGKRAREVAQAYAGRLAIRKSTRDNARMSSGKDLDELCTRTATTWECGRWD